MKKRAVTQRTTTTAMRAVLWIGGGLVAVAWVQLFVLSSATDRFFAWTIATPLSAASLGAFYGSAAVIAVLSARERVWARAKMGVPGVVVFVSLTLAATLLHLDQFHLDDGPFPARLAAWAWLVIYAVQPPLLGAIYLSQLGKPGIDPVGGPPQGVWLRLILGALAVLALAVGAMLFGAPQSAAELWPWPMGPLVARASGAWLVGFAVLLGLLARESDPTRARASFGGLGCAGTLQLLALLRFHPSVEWSSPLAWAVVGFFVAFVCVGAVGWRWSAGTMDPRQRIGWARRSAP